MYEILGMLVLNERQISLKWVEANSIADMIYWQAVLERKQKKFYYFFEKVD